MTKIKQDRIVGRYNLKEMYVISLSQVSRKRTNETQESIAFGIIKSIKKDLFSRKIDVIPPCYENLDEVDIITSSGTVNGFLYRAICLGGGGYPEYQFILRTTQDEKLVRDAIKKYMSKS